MDVARSVLLRRGFQMDWCLGGRGDGGQGAENRSMQLQD